MPLLGGRPGAGGGGLKKKMGAVEATVDLPARPTGTGLAEAEIFDRLCPRKSGRPEERMKEPRFARMQKRPVTNGGTDQ